MVTAHVWPHIIMFYVVMLMVKSLNFYVSYFGRKHVTSGLDHQFNSIQFNKRLLISEKLQMP